MSNSERSALARVGMTLAKKKTVQNNAHTSQTLKNLKKVREASSLPTTCKMSLNTSLQHQNSARTPAEILPATTLSIL
jgi:hypothetical protein